MLSYLLRVFATVWSLIAQYVVPEKLTVHPVDVFDRLVALGKVSHHDFASFGEAVTDSYSIGAQQPAHEPGEVHGIFQVAPFHTQRATSPRQYASVDPHAYFIGVETNRS